MISTVIFDLDDTLYDEIDYCRSGFLAVSQYVAERFPGASAKALCDAMLRQFEAGNRKTVFNAALKSCRVSFDDDFMATLIEAYRNHHPSLTLPPESKKALDELGKRYKLAMLTDGFLPAQRLKVQALGIERYFQSIIYTEELGREHWKPSPLGFQKIMFDLGVEAGECVYVGDNEEKDFAAPNSLGIVTVKIAKPTSLHTAAAADAEARPSHTIYAIDDLIRLVKGL
jgi:putative hydrolase of the HAD superfamily